MGSRLLAGTSGQSTPSLKRDLHLRVLVALSCKCECGHGLAGRYGSGEQRRDIDQTAIETIDRVLEFAVEPHRAAVVDLLRHHQIPRDRKPSWRKRTYLHHSGPRPHRLQTGRETRGIAGDLERHLEAAGALGFRGE